MLILRDSFISREFIKVYFLNHYAVFCFSIAFWLTVILLVLLHILKFWKKIGTPDIGFLILCHWFRKKICFTIRFCWNCKVREEILTVLTYINKTLDLLSYRHVTINLSLGAFLSANMVSRRKKSFFSREDKTALGDTILTSTHGVNFDYLENINL